MARRWKTIEWLCWIGTGSVPAGGTSTNTGSFTLTTNSTLTWLWITNDWLAASATTGGTVDVSNGWKTNGAAVQITAADSDGDGQLSWQEYIAGTNPTNSASSFRITGGSVTPAGVVIRWSSESNRTYNLGRTANLLEAFAGLAGATNPPATPPENVYTNPAPDGDSAFYQIRVQQ